MWTKRFYRICSGKLFREKTFANWWKIRFSRRKPSRIARFCRATPNFAEKTFVNSHKTAKLAQKFSPSKFFRYFIDPLASHLSSLSQFLHNNTNKKATETSHTMFSEWNQVKQDGNDTTTLSHYPHILCHFANLTIYAPHKTLYLAYTSVMIYHRGASLSEQHTDLLCTKQDLSHTSTFVDESSPKIARYCICMPTARTATLNVTTYA